MPSFIEITKYELRNRLKEKNIRWKDQDDICDIVKKIIYGTLDTIIENAIIQHTYIIEKNQTLNDFEAKTINKE